MSEHLLEAILEKMESIELLLKVTDSGKDEIQKLRSEVDFIRKEIKNLPTYLQPDSGKIKELTAGIDKLLLQLQTPVKNQVEHKHHFHKGTWIAVGLVVTCFLLGWGWLNCHKEKEQFEANDIKFRSFKISGLVSLEMYCNDADSLYQKDPNDFRNRVEQEEQRLIDQAELYRRAGEREEEAKTLKEKARRSVRKP